MDHRVERFGAGTIAQPHPPAGLGAPRPLGARQRIADVEMVLEERRRTVGGHGAPICWYWRADADGNATWGPTSRPVPQWTRPGATPVETLGRQGEHH